MSVGEDEATFCVDYETSSSVFACSQIALNVLVTYTLFKCTKFEYDLNDVINNQY